VTSFTCPYTEQILTYVIGECTPDEQAFWEAHLAGCPSCREEAAHLQMAWRSIPFMLEETEPPPGLKEEVMHAIFQPAAPASPPRAWRSFLDKAKQWATAPYPRVVTIVLLLGFVGTLWQNLTLRERLSALETPVTLPASVVQEFSLKAASPAMADARGSAWLYRQGEKRVIIVHVQGLAATQGGEAYQIWLIHHGKRTSAGVFRVDQSGSGVCMYDMTGEDLVFEAIGITLEPDANGSQPRGKKVLGTT
jgi:anti-sigma factor RsiW